MYRIRRLWQRLTQFIKILKEATSVIAALLTILSLLGLGNIVIGYFNNTPPVIFIGVGIIVFSIIIGIVFFSLVSNAPEENSAGPIGVRYPPPPSAEVELLLKEIVYEYFSDGQTMRLRKRFKLRALRDGVDSFPDRYKWTGQGKCIVKSITPAFRVVNERKIEFWDYFDVVFPHPIRKGEIVEFTIQWDLFDEKRTAVPFLSTMIDLPTEHLILRVKLPRKLKPKYAMAYEFKDYIDTLPIYTQELHWNPTTESLEYEVRSPKLYHKYMIRWFSGGNDSNHVNEVERLP